MSGEKLTCGFIFNHNEKSHLFTAFHRIWSAPGPALPVGVFTNILLNFAQHGAYCTVASRATIANQLHKHAPHLSSPSRSLVTRAL